MRMSHPLNQMCLSVFCDAFAAGASSNSNPTAETRQHVRITESVSSHLDSSYSSWCGRCENLCVVCDACLLNFVDMFYTFLAAEEAQTCPF